MNITEIVKKECVRVPLVASEKVAVITELVDLLADQKLLADRDEVLRAVLARERTRSTGIGRGLAVPHGKSRGCPNLVMAVGKPESPLEFGSSDGRPCELVVLLASPIDKTGPHIQALARVSRLWLDEGFRRDVSDAANADELFAVLERHQQ